VAAVVRRAGGRAGGGGGGAAVRGGVRGGEVLEAGLAAGGVRVWGQGRGRGGRRRGGGGFGARWRGDDGRALQDLVADAARLPVPASTPEEKGLQSVRWNSEGARRRRSFTTWFEIGLVIHLIAFGLLKMCFPQRDLSSGAVTYRSCLGRPFLIRD
jgi:hypothetical protein